MLALGGPNARLGESMARAARSEAEQEDPVSSFEREGLFWYLHLRLGQFREAGDSDADIERRTKISKQQVGQIQRGIRSGGLLSLIRLARGEGVTPGQLLDKAIAWWETRGAEFRDRRIRELAEERAAGKKPKAASPKRRSLAASLAAVEGGSKLPRSKQG